MNNVQTCALLLGSLIGLVLVGRSLRRHLPDHHLSADSRDAVKLAMGLVATMTALLLGLLVSSAKGTYDTQRSEVLTMAAKVSFLDRVLAAYGPEAAGVRVQLRATADEAIRHMWPDEASAPAELKPKAAAAEAFYEAVHRLVPQTETQRALKAQASTLAMELGQLRMLLVAQMVPSIPKPLLITVVVWLGMIFLSFSLLAPPNATTTLSLIAAALSVAGAVFLILELDQPLGGVIRLSSQPMRNALTVLSP